MHSDESYAKLYINTGVDVTGNDVARRLWPAVLSMPTTLTVRAAHVDNDL